MSVQRATPHARRHLRAWDTDDSLPNPARVLLAEDDRELRRLLAGVLRKQGYFVKEAGTGFELLEHLGSLIRQNTAFDLIVTDIRMPGVTGLSVVEGLRNGHTRGRCGTPVILITAFGDEDTHAEARRLGAVILDKPFDLEDFRDCALNMVSPALT